MSLVHTLSTASIKRRQNSLKISITGLKSSFGRARSRVNLAPTKKPSSKVFPFFRLPRKIRDQIYSELFKLLIPARVVVREPNGYACFQDDTFPRAAFPSFCYVSHKIHTESLPLLLKHSEVILENLFAVKILSDYLKTGLNLRFVRGITSLTFRSTIAWHPQATQTTRGLIEKCKSLRQVKIEVPASACVEWEDGKLRVKQKKYIIDTIDLCCLLDCENLKKVTLSCWGGAQEAKTMDLQVDAVFEPVVLWVQQNICRGSGVRLLVEHGKGLGLGDGR
ncbi:hypothetical protein P280DRAFT_197716 [Massarina eburnea CBS 473.64]|uniref:Uncharacterized protein n=1 Tax=Massarina eburnea CBS 473.64 TaxID=1395130 RepID=A0A6A6RIW0_9PLEO|nr:hypothetical protein P280DRAFT_197716 [Massarina eburnea CBS 473.64]